MLRVYLKEGGKDKILALMKEGIGLLKYDVKGGEVYNDSGEDYIMIDCFQDNIARSTSDIPSEYIKRVVFKYIAHGIRSLSVGKFIYQGATISVKPYSVGHRGGAEWEWQDFQIDAPNVKSMVDIYKLASSHKFDSKDDLEELITDMSRGKLERMVIQLQNDLASSQKQ